MGKIYSTGSWPPLLALLLWVRFPHSFPPRRAAKEIISPTFESRRKASTADVALPSPKSTPIPGTPIPGPLGVFAQGPFQRFSITSLSRMFGVVCRRDDCSPRGGD